MPTEGRAARGVDSVSDLETYSEERRLAWFEPCDDGLFRIDLDVPLSCRKRGEEAMRHVHRHARLRECNAMMRSILGISNAEASVDEQLGAHSVILTLLTELVNSGFQRKDFEVKESPIQGALRIHATGVYQKDSLVRVWGHCRAIGGPDLQDRRLADALEAQRRQIGLELHDGVGQLLTAIRIRSQDLIDHAGRYSDTLKDECLRLANETGEALALLRALTIDLSPAGLIRGDSLRDAIELLVESTRDLGIDCALSWDGGFRFGDPAARAHAFRIVQESLNNAIKHAQASSIRVAGSTDDTDFVLVVEDDGVGFVAEHERDTLGLESLHHRARAIDASISIESRPGAGTIVTCRIPLSLGQVSLDEEHRLYPRLATGP